MHEEFICLTHQQLHMDISHLINKVFKTSASVNFTILNVEGYTEERVSKQFKGVLAVKQDHLVAINYRKTLIPNLTLPQGVARITAVSVDNKTFNRPGAISAALGITEPMMPISVNEVL
jgi:hypothetical protein